MGTFADALTAARSRRFVGREAELQLFAQMLSDPDSAPVVVVQAPGGVGKSMLLRAFRAQASGAGCRTYEVDLRSLEPTPDAFLGELGAQHFPGAADSPDGGRNVVTVDTYERAGSLDTWVWEEWLPNLPAGTLVAIAGRDLPATRLRTDPGWQELVQRIQLRNFTPEETADFLQRAGVPPRHHVRAAELTHGHPLAVSLLADVLREQHDVRLDSLADTPDVLGALVTHFLDAVPGREHERALQVCAHAWITTQDLLADVLDTAQSAQLMTWLRDLSFVEEGRHGLFPHDLARDVLDADLRWRDPPGYTELHRRLQRATLDRARVLTGADQQRAIMQIVFAHRRHPLTAAYWDYAALGQVYADALRRDDEPLLLSMTERHQGAEQAAAVRYWLQHQPSAFHVARTTVPQPVGFACILRLDRLDEDQRTSDPAVQQAWEALEAHRPVRPGEHVTMLRFLVDAESGQAPSRTLNLGPVLTIRLLLSDPDLGWDLLSFADTGAMDGLMGFADYHRLPEATYQVGDIRYGTWGHDFRRRDPGAYFDLIAARELGEPVPQTPDPEADRLALPYPQFHAAVKSALKDLRRPEQLARNPLTRSRVVADATTPGTPEERLATLVREAAGEVASEPRDRKLFHALDRTYLRPAPTQEAAAEVLGLPFSTYRRHLAAGIERLVEVLWHREL